MKTVELFCGTKSFSKVATKRGHTTFTLDNDSQFSPDRCVDIFTWNANDVENVDIVWASPPCQGFSVCRIGKNWNKDATPKTDRAREAMSLVKRTLEVIDSIKPVYWFIENPRGMLRKMTWLDTWVKQHGGIRHTVTYCQYGDQRQKPTDIWTNNLNWQPKKECPQGAPCHQSAPRGSRTTGTQGLKNAAERGRIPEQLFEEIFDSI